ncbi:MAG: LysM peptidoglycan-binding domain-containing protein [Ruminococcaceae bacterium]|nr:LysM peptidoglycan-binding domain-containing protein [Oscillospiraceae bacterium]
MVIHVVQPGDSIYTIATRYGVPMQKVISDNRLENPEQLVVGQTIVISADIVPHTVAAGESLYSIARDYRVTVSGLLRLNPEISDPSRIQAGQVIQVPAVVPKLGTIDVNGYAFPNISSATLQDTLPNLSFISLFSYQVRPDGSLNPIDDSSIIQAARARNVGPFMVITNIKEGGSFDSELAHTILISDQLQNTLLDNVIAVLRKGYYGLDIDFEYLYPRDRENYNRFIRKVVDRLHPLGYKVTTALAPKTSAGQVGLLYEAHDYAAHGATVDHVILMTYEWGYTYSPPRAVAPINLVEQVIRYAVTVIPSQKILMGIPNYGYNWTLPYVRGSAARAISHTAAVALAARVRARIEYDTTAQSPYFRYYDENRRQHEVWFEDARSIQAKLELVQKYNLGGVSYWTINSFFPQNWLVLDSMYNVRKPL